MSSSDPTRRDALMLGAGAAAIGALPLGSVATAAPAPRITAPAPPLDVTLSRNLDTLHWRRGIEGQRRADLGNDTFLNPVLAGDHPDPSVLRDGKTYYKVSSSFDYYPALVLWKSQDLVNWTVIGPTLTQPIGSVLAPDLVKHNGRYFIYVAVLNVAFPIGSGPAPYGKRPAVTNYVIHADAIEGSWSDPIELPLRQIDPGHAVGEDGKRYLFLAGGYRAPLTDDGLALAGKVVKVVEHWPIPPEWAIEGTELESPKVLRRGDYFYIFWAQGGTAGPPTSHMVVVARSRSINGPWEYAPTSPLLRTADPSEPWWSRGHATAVEGPRGDWWLVYHGYENGYRTLGRQMLLEPMTWGADGWPRATGGTLARPLRKPVPSSRDAHGMAFSDDFSSAAFGTRLVAFEPDTGYQARNRVEGGRLVMDATGTAPRDGNVLVLNAADRRYVVTAKLELGGEATAALLLWYHEKVFCGVSASATRATLYKIGQAAFYLPAGPAAGETPWLRLVNDAQVATFLISNDGRDWRKIVSFDVTGYNHNLFERFLALRPAIVALGKGTVRVDTVTYEAF